MKAIQLIKKRKYDKIWREKHPDYFIDYFKKYRLEHPDTIRKAKEKYNKSKKGKETIRKYEESAERRAYKREWMRTHRKRKK